MLRSCSHLFRNSLAHELIGTKGAFQTPDASVGTFRKLDCCRCDRDTYRVRTIVLLSVTRVVGLPTRLHVLNGTTDDRIGAVESARILIEEFLIQTPARVLKSPIYINKL